MRSVRTGTRKFLRVWASGSWIPHHVRWCSDISRHCPENGDCRLSPAHFPRYHACDFVRHTDLCSGKAIAVWVWINWRVIGVNELLRTQSGSEIVRLESIILCECAYAPVRWCAHLCMRKWTKQRRERGKERGRKEREKKSGKSEGQRHTDNSDIDWKYENTDKCPDNYLTRDWWSNQSQAARQKWLGRKWRRKMRVLINRQM